MRRLPGLHVAGARRAEDPRGVHERRRRRLARAQPRPLRGHRALLPPGLQREPRRRVDPGARRRRGQAARRHARRRRRLRPRRLDDHHGARPTRPRSSSASTTTRRRSRPRASAPRTRASPTACASRSRPRAASPARLRPRHDVRLPARHGRSRSAPRGTCAARSTQDGTWLIVEPFAGDKVEDNLNPVGRVYYGASTLVCTPASLSQEVGLGLGAQAGEARLRDVVTAGGFTPLPARDRDALQPRARGAAVSYTIAAMDTRRSATRAREPDLVGLVARGGVRVAYESFGDGRAHDPLPAELDARPPAPVEGAGAVPRAPLPRRHVRPARQRRLRPARGRGRLRRPRGRRRRARRARRARASSGRRSSALSRGAAPALHRRRRAPRARARRWSSSAPTVPARAAVPSRGVDFDAELPEYEGWERFNRHAWRSDFAGFCEWFFGDDLLGAALDPADRERASRGRAARPRELLADDRRRGAPERGRDARAGAPRALPGARDRRRRRPHPLARRTAPSSRAEHGRPARHARGQRPFAQRARSRARSTSCCASSLLPPPPPADLAARARPPAARARSSRRRSASGTRAATSRSRASCAALRPGPRDRLARAAADDGAARGARRARSTRPAPSSRASARTSRRRRASTRLPVFEALRRMDEILVANFMLFHDVAREGCYDLWIGDEAWEVDHFLHENPELKSGAVRLADRLRRLPAAPRGRRARGVPDGRLQRGDGRAGRALPARARPRDLRRRARRHRRRAASGPGLPEIRPWVEQHYEFSGPHHRLRPADGRRARGAPARARLGRGRADLPRRRRRLGRRLAPPRSACWRPSRRRAGSCRACAWSRSAGRASTPRRSTAGGVELHGYVDGLHRWLDACDIGVVQGGLTTTMELVAARQPFLSFPLERHFEQQLHVAHRLAAPRRRPAHGVRVGDARANRRGDRGGARRSGRPTGRCRAGAQRAPPPHRAAARVAGHSGAA